MIILNILGVVLVSASVSYLTSEFLSPKKYEKKEVNIPEEMIQVLDTNDYISLEEWKLNKNTDNQ